jgi:hypothetical protein
MVLALLVDVRKQIQESAIAIEGGIVVNPETSRSRLGHGIAEAWQECDFRAVRPCREHREDGEVRVLLVDRLLRRSKPGRCGDVDRTVDDADAGDRSTVPSPDATSRCSVVTARWRENAINALNANTTRASSMCY